MTPQERYDLIQQAMQAFNPFYREAVQTVFADYEIQGRDWFYAYLAYGLEPEPLTAVLLQQMTPYANSQTQAEWLLETVEKGFLQTVGDNSCRLTASGRAPVEAFFTAARQAIAPLAPLVPAEMARLAELLAQIIAATEALPTPALKTHMRISRRTDPGPAAVPATKIDQYLTDLLRFRDDAHLAAWVNLGVDGRTWDAFSAVWREDNISAASLAETLSNRNFTADDYAASLDELLNMGWVQDADGAYRLTESGLKIREEAEETTNRYYFSGWSALTAAESAELDDLLAALRRRLQEMAADQATAANESTGALAGEISASLFQLTRPVMDPLMEELRLAERGLGFGLIQAGYFDPDPISVERARRRAPYGSPDSWRTLFTKLSAQGLLSSSGSGDYQLTGNGRSALNHLLHTFRSYLATVEVDVDLDKLAALLGRIVGACLTAPEPPGTWSIRHSHNLTPADEAAPLAKIDQYLDDLNAFRDDAHLASFAPYDISGHGWELFTQIWRGDVNTAAEMAEKMAFRGHDQAAYTAALDDLAARGWVKITSEGIAKLTAAGIKVREDAEKQTDRYFFLPWLVLNQSDTAELLQLMTSAKEQLQQLAQPEPSPA
jgi:Mn-dependent DtxR family transcriptional regulator